MVRTSDNVVARFHALWTLEGLNALTPALVREEMKDKEPRMRIQAIRASETLYKAGDKSFADDYKAMAKDPDTNVTIQAMLSLSLFKVPDAPEVIKSVAGDQQGQGCRADRRTPAGAAAGEIRAAAAAARR